jgi:hypothetical protein
MQQPRPASRCNRMRTAQVVLKIEPKLKAAAEKAAAANRRSLGGLIEMLPSDYCKQQAPPRVSSRFGAAAAEMAASTIDHIRDKTAPEEEHQRRKRRLIHGPKEFRGIRQKEHA